MPRRDRSWGVAFATATVLATAMATSAGAAGSPAPLPLDTAAQNGKLVFEGLGVCVQNTDCFSSMAPTYDIWSVNPDGTGLANLTQAPGVDADAQWSPDGSKIVFNSNRNGSYDIFVMDADGSDVQQLTDDPANESYAAWSPNGKRIAFVDDSRRNNSIMIMTADGDVRRRITTRWSSVWALAWSPDGRHIAFTRVIRHRSGGNTAAGDQFDLFLVRPDGTGLRRLTARYDGLVSSNANWAPDGRRLVFDGKRCDDRGNLGTCDEWAIFTIRRNGRGLRRIASTGSWVEAPEWSPDGTTIVYTSDEGDRANYGDLWFVDPDGSNERQAIIKPDTYDYEVDWQPTPSG